MFIFSLNENSVSWKPNFAKDGKIEWQSLNKKLETQFKSVELSHAAIKYNEFGKQRSAAQENAAQVKWNTIDISRFGIDTDILSERNINEFIHLLKSSKTTRSMYFSIIDSDELLYDNSNNNSQDIVETPALPEDPHGGLVSGQAGTSKNQSALASVEIEEPKRDSGVNLQNVKQQDGSSLEVCVLLQAKQ